MKKLRAKFKEYVIDERHKETAQNTAEIAQNGKLIREIYDKNNQKIGTFRILRRITSWID